MARFGVAWLAWLGLAWLGLAWLGLAWLGLAWLGLAWLGLAWLGLAWLGLAWLGLAWLGLAWLGLAWLGLAWLGLAWLGLAWLGLAWLGLAWLGLAWLGLAWLGLAWLGLAWLGLAWLGLAWAWLGLAWLGLAWLGLAWLGLAWLGTDVNKAKAGRGFLCVSVCERGKVQMINKRNRRRINEKKQNQTPRKMLSAFYSLFSLSDGFVGGIVSINELLPNKSSPLRSPLCSFHPSHTLVKAATLQRPSTSSVHAQILPHNDGHWHPCSIL